MFGSSRRTVLALFVSLGVVAATFGAPPGGGSREAANARSLEALRAELSQQLEGRVGHPEPTEDRLAREQWFYGQRMFPGTNLPQVARLAAVRQAAGLPVVGSVGGASGATVQPASLASTTGTWTLLGPQPIDSNDTTYNDPFGGTPPNAWHDVSGRITALAVDPSKSRIVYAGGAAGGVWKTTDGGVNWTPIGDDLPTTAIGSIGIAPRDPQVIYVGTGESNTSADSYYGAGIFRSTNGGASFTQVGGTLFDRATVFRLGVAGDGTLVFAATNHGLYRSHDGGAHWKRVLAPGGSDDLFGNFVTDVQTLPGTRGKQVLAVVGWRGGDLNNGLYLSVDGGKTFTFLASPPGFAPQPNIGRVSFAVSQKRPGEIVAAVQDAVCFNAGFCPPGTVFNGVYVTQTGPLGPWAKVADADTLAADPNSAQNPAKIGPGYQPGIGAWYNLYVEIDPLDPDHFVLGLEEIYDTDDGGATWHTIGRYWNFCLSNLLPNCGLDPDEHPTTHPDQHAAAFGVRNGQSKLYVGNDGGVWSQVGPDLNNDDWTNLNQELAITQPYYATAAADGTVYAGTQDNGTAKFTGSPVWPEIFGGDGGDVAVEPDDADHTYEEYVYLDMYKSSDGGKTWTDIYTPDSDSSATARFIAPFDLDPLDEDHLVALGQHVWESDQGIDTESSDWQESYDNGDGHVGTALAVRGATIYEGWCGPCNPSVIDEDTPFDRGMATNQGGTWHATAATGLPNRYITSFTIDPADDAHVFATVSAFSRRWIPRAGEGHVFESTDAGENFTDISSNLPDAPANDTVLVDGTLVVGTDVGVFVRQGGGTWARLGTGLPNVSVLDLFVVPGTSTVIAATHGRGVWAIDV